MEGEAEQAGPLQPGGEEVQGTFLMGQVKERSQGLLSGAQGENRRQQAQTETWEILCKHQKKPPARMVKRVAQRVVEFPSLEIQRTQLDTVLGKERSVLIFRHLQCNSEHGLQKNAAGLTQENVKEDVREGMASLQGWD